MRDKGVGADFSTYDNIDWCGFGTGSNVATVDVKDGKVLRVRPLRYDKAFTRKELNPWVMEHKGLRFEEPTKSLIPPFSAAYKKHAFSKHRIPYPLKRVDWDPNGDRHPENRGTSKFVRISWDEATDIIASELKRQYELYGPGSILLQQDGHGETKIVHPSHGCMVKLCEIMGGSTIQARQPDSWEGWYWGAKHTWGIEPLGQGYDGNLVWDITKNSGMVLYWGCDNETTTWGWGGQMPSRVSFWWTKCGIKSVFICPDLNYSAAVHADKWIPVYPNTDLALQMGIAYVWMTEGLYDRDYIDTHTVGFDWLEYEVLQGGESGVPKTPEWASERCGVPSRTIKALAREWHRVPTSTAHCNGGSYIRSCYAHEPGRMEVCLLAMQGLGKPGRNFMKFIEWNIYENDRFNPMPRDVFKVTGWAGYNASMLQNQDRFIPKTLIPEGIMAEKPFSWYGHVICMAEREDQFLKFQFPREKEDGTLEPYLHMLWSDAPCWSTCWNGGNEYIKALRSDKLEFVLYQHPWLENDVLYGDIILPITSRFENDDCAIDNQGGLWNSVIKCDKCVEPKGEAKSDWEAVQAIAEKLGLLEEYTEGRTVEDSIRLTFEHSNLEETETYEEFCERGIAISPHAKGWENDSPGLFDFYSNPKRYPLPTPSGLIEIYSTALAEHFPDDKERMPYPHYIADSPRFHEYRESEKAKKYPFLLVTNHPRWRIHANFDDNSWFREIETCKVVGPDGYAYEPVWVNPVDAERLGLENGDIVKVENDRGWTMGGVYITERIMPGAVLQDHGAETDPIEPGVSDRGGANNLIAPKETTSQNAAGEVTSGYLVNIEKVDVFELAKQYPEAFGRTFDAEQGVDIENWIVQED
ncbi:MAG: molybdopterin-dependent oxidoreductase [Coriobacteriales bacterium]